MKFPKVPVLLAVDNVSTAVFKTSCNTAVEGIQILPISPYES